MLALVPRLRRFAVGLSGNAADGDDLCQAAIEREGAQESAVELGNVDRALSRLPDEQREAVLLVMVEGYAYKEAAEIVGCPVGTLNSRLVRGRDALLQLLGETP